MVGFKAEANIPKNELISLAKKKMNESNADMIIANDIGSKRYKKNPESNEVLIIDSNRVISSGWMKKEKIAKLIIKEIENKIKI
ncbi:phosphopantothenate--cysteine ligase [compost metagenome]